MHRAYHPSPHRPRRRLRWWRLVPWIVAAYVLTGFYSVQPNERAVVRRCGRVLSRDRGPGLHYGFPYGIDRVTKVRVLEQKQIGVGVSRSGRTLGRPIQPQQAECLTGDNNVILLSANVQYQIDDIHRFLFGAVDVPRLVENAVAGALCEAITAMGVDEVLTTGRATIQREVRSNAQATLDRYGAGVRIASVLLDERTEPPQEVAGAFRDVTAAREDRQRAINEAEGYRARLRQQADADADSIVQQAEAFSRKTVFLAESGAERFCLLQAELAKGRELTVRRLILETMEEILPRMKKIVADREATRSVDLGIVEPRE